MARTARVFLSYRRDDSKHAAARIAERLDERFQGSSWTLTPFSRGWTSLR